MPDVVFSVATRPVLVIAPPCVYAQHPAVLPRSLREKSVLPFQTRSLENGELNHDCIPSCMQSCIG